MLPISQPKVDPKQDADISEMVDRMESTVFGQGME